MNKKAARTFSAIAVAMIKLDKDHDNLIKDIHKIIADEKDGYPEFDFIATVNNFRCFSGYHNMVNKE